MKIEKLTKTDEKISFLATGISNSLTNSIRRAIYEIPILAVDSLEISKNDSALYDEILAHRFGLIPLKAPKNFTLRTNCTCKGKGCLKCTASFKLTAKGPCTVYSKDIKTKGFQPAYDEIPIVILDKEQELELTGEAVLGIGLEHTKFVPGLLWFNDCPQINAKNLDSLSKEEKEDFAKICPLKAITLKDNKIIINNLKCDMCNACVELAKKKEKSSVEIIPSSQNFVIFIESFGQISPEEIFSDAINILNKNLDEFAKEIKKIK